MRCVMMHRRPYPYYSPNDFTGYPEQAFYQMPPPPQSFQQYPYGPYQSPYQAQPDQSQLNQNPFQQLAKPTQPTHWPDVMQQNFQNHQGEPFMQQNQSNHQEDYQQYQQNQSFYPPPNYQPRPNFMNQFQGSDGQLDFNKMLSTVGQLANTVQQVSPVIQQVGSLMKSFKA